MSASTSTTNASLASPHSNERLYVNLPKCWDTLHKVNKKKIVGWVQVIDAEITEPIEYTLSLNETLKFGSDKTKCDYPLKINNLSGVYFELAVINQCITFKNIMLPSVKVEGAVVNTGHEQRVRKECHIVIPNCTTKFVVHHLQPTTIKDNSNDKKYKKLVDKNYIMTSTKLGWGTQELVYLGINRATGERVAIKSSPQGRHQRMFLQEVRILQELIGRPHFIQLVDAHATSQAMYIVLQHAWGSLGRYIRLHGTIPEECAKEIFKQLLKGIKILHDNDIVHRDIKPHNILLLEFSEAPTAVYADFGLIYQFASPGLVITSFAGTKAYVAPEVIRTNHDWENIKSRVGRLDSVIAEQLDSEPFIESGYDQASDMWSLGVVLFEMVFGYLPFGESGQLHFQLHNILAMDVNAHNQDGQVKDECMELIRNLLVVNADERYTAEEALACAWLAEPEEEASSSAPPQQSHQGNRRLPFPPTRTHYPREAKRLRISYRY
ncbi:kinase-like domain-containing protein [Syncephalis plumigaleata]|nr:kinase-like domain-containing protein [Syncephalis plumigaleata]